MIPELICDVLFIFSIAASEPIVKSSPYTSSHFDSVSSSNSQNCSFVDYSQQSLNNTSGNNGSGRDVHHAGRAVNLTLSQSCRAIFQTTYLVMDVLVGSMEKLGHEGCWTNFLALLSHISTAVEEGLLDDQGFFENIVHGSTDSSDTSKKTNNGNIMQMRIGVCARAQLVQTSSPASLCAAARVFASLARQNSSFARQLLRDGVGEFAIAGLNTQGI